MGEKINSEAVFSRIREVYSLSSDAAMARKLDIFPQDIPRFRKTGTLPYKQILDACPSADWAYLFTGEAPPLAEQSVESALKALKAAGFTVTLG